MYKKWRGLLTGRAEPCRGVGGTTVAPEHDPVDHPGKEPLPTGLELQPELHSEFPAGEEPRIETAVERVTRNREETLRDIPDNVVDFGDEWHGQVAHEASEHEAHHAANGPEGDQSLESTVIRVIHVRHIHMSTVCATQ